MHKRLITCSTETTSNLQKAIWGFLTFFFFNHSQISIYFLFYTFTLFVIRNVLKNRFSFWFALDLRLCIIVVLSCKSSVAVQYNDSSVTVASLPYAYVFLLQQELLQGCSKARQCEPSGLRYFS